MQVRMPLVLPKMPLFPALNVTARSKPNMISIRHHFTLTIHTAARTVK